MSDRIKVAGYAQKVVYDGSIEYRNFTPDLVGIQLASDGGTPLFTMGSFAITTNLDPKLDKTFNTSKFSNFVTLSDLGLTIDQTQTLLTNNAGVYLNLDKTNLDYYALFGSLTEFVRVSLEDIIINWPASLYLNPVQTNSLGQPFTGYTVENYVYDSIYETATFKINTNFINNKFGINYTTTGSIINTFNETNDMRNLTMNFSSYAILNGLSEYQILAFTASTNQTNDYIYLKAKGNPFSGITNNSSLVYHIKPNKVSEENFFNSIPEFENYLLSRDVSPIYTATFKYPIKSDTGIILYITKQASWPVSDGYNIDFDTPQYIGYANKLLDIANTNDLYSSNLMNRFLVSESISAFDTMPVHLSDLDQDTSGQKVNKTLQIYGREFDEINNFILGIKFANTVSYDKLDNTPDIYLKNLASVLGWDLISSVLENDLLKNYVTTKPSTYSGQSVGLTAVEADIELWRRIILSTPWLWKSKGTRKAIEFLFKFIGAPNGLIKFNEYIYKADAPLDISLFQEILTLNGLSNDISSYPIDSDGYPSPFPNTSTMYFQNDGLWYRETGGSGSTIDILTGNNPHVGPYDGGNKYMNQFRALIPNYSPVTLSTSTQTTDSTNLYLNYDLGRFDTGVSTATTVDTVQITTDNGVDLNDCIIFTPTIEKDPNPSTSFNDCGCEVPTEDNILSLCVYKKEQTIDPCPKLSSYSDDTSSGLYNFQYNQYRIDGSVFKDTYGNPILNSSLYTSQSCCKKIGGSSHIYKDVENGVLVNTGYYCCDDSGKCGCSIACKWMVQPDPILLPINSTTQSNYLQFTMQDNSSSVVTPDGCNCIPDYTIAVPNIIDPYTGEVGYACQLTPAGVIELARGQNNGIYSYYSDRSTGVSSCY